MMRRSERRLTLTTRSLRAPTSCRSSAVFSSLSFPSGRAIRASRRLFAVVVEFQVMIEIAGRRRVRGLLEMNDRPLPAERGGAQPAVGIDGDGMPKRGEKRGVVMRIGVTPAIRQFHIVRGGVVRTPDRFLVARHHGFSQPAGRATAAEDDTAG